MPTVLGQSPAFTQSRAQLRRFAACDAPVLIEGETGTGKELAAREVHYASARRLQPFVPVNCGAIPDSLVENELFGHTRGAFTDARQAQRGLVDHARGGSLFLDEVDALSVRAQITLLRFLQDHEYRAVGGGPVLTADVRIIAASNASLDRLVAESGFRRDLHYRLNALYVHLPPLRERGDDIVILARHFLCAAAECLKLPPRTWSEPAAQALRAYSWPGNVRELENIALRACLRADSDVVGMAELMSLEPAMATCTTRTALDSPNDVPTFRSAKRLAVTAFEWGYLTDLMRRTHGNVSEAARLSGTERRQLGKMLKKHGIDQKASRPTQ